MSNQSDGSKFLKLFCRLASLPPNCPEPQGRRPPAVRRGEGVSAPRALQDHQPREREQGRQLQPAARLPRPQLWPGAARREETQQDGHTHASQGGGVLQGHVIDEQSITRPVDLGVEGNCGEAPSKKLLQQRPGAPVGRGQRSKAVNGPSSNLTMTCNAFAPLMLLL